MRLVLLAGVVAALLCLLRPAAPAPPASLPCVTAGPLYVLGQQVLPYTQECPPL